VLTTPSVNTRPQRTVIEGIMDHCTPRLCHSLKANFSKSGGTDQVGQRVFGLSIHLEMNLAAPARRMDARNFIEMKHPSFGSAWAPVCPMGSNPF
jgi:hypothetical protein